LQAVLDSSSAERRAQRPVGLLSERAAAAVESTSFDSAGLAAALRQAAPGDGVRLQAGVFELSDAPAAQSKRA
jgi:hypothetical protein